MISRSLAVGLLAAGCLTAAAGGSYLAVRHNAAEARAESLQAVPAAEPAPAAGVSETEAVVTLREAESEPAPATPPTPLATVERPEPRREARPAPRQVANPPVSRRAARPEPTPEPAVTTTPPIVPAVEAVPERTVSEPAPPPEPVVVEPEFTAVTVPASAVIGLEIESTVSSESARIEDRVDARVTRDVYADGRLAIPAGSRVLGHVTLVERGGKLKDRARLGVRFHTLVLADGRQTSLRTETIYREGDSPGEESSKKIGGAAVGGAVLGAILGGGKGAMTGATIGAAGGTAAVMAGGRNPAILASGSVINARLASPVTLDVER